MINQGLNFYFISILETIKTKDLWLYVLLVNGLQLSAWALLELNDKMNNNCDGLNKTNNQVVISYM